MLFYIQWAKMVSMKRLGCECSEDTKKYGTWNDALKEFTPRLLVMSQTTIC